VTGKILLRTGRRPVSAHRALLPAAHPTRDARHKLRVEAEQAVQRRRIARASTRIPPSNTNKSVAGEPVSAARRRAGPSWEVVGHASCACVTTSAGTSIVAMHVEHRLGECILRAMMGRGRYKDYARDLSLGKTRGAGSNSIVAQTVAQKPDRHRCTRSGKVNQRAYPGFPNKPPGGLAGGRFFG